ncbi:MAG TPA: thiamine pyrophosphate-dependent enzyme [Thermomicrobiaceae bacterium]|nr:thiamine pyrophosphate-dependent enzyme [Thermomicrobiaceae bacterium]
MTGGQALVASLIKQGVDTVFGLPGVQLDWLFDALWEKRDQIKVYYTRHEQGTAYMADGYARTTGKVGTCIVVPGPGLLNAMAGLSTAYSASSPVLCVTGQIRSDAIEQGRGLLHEIPNQLGMVRSATKWAARANTPAEVPGVVEEAFRQLRSDRVRPVEIEVPPDILQGSGQVTIPGRVAEQRIQGDPKLLDKAAKLLGEAQRPVIVAGGGVIRSGASEGLKALADMLQAPVVMSSHGKGALSYRDDLALNPNALDEVVPNADVVLLVGNRYVEYGVNDWWRPAKDQVGIRLDTDAEMLERSQPTLGILTDAMLGLAELVERVGKYNHPREPRSAEVKALKAHLEDLWWEVQPQAAYATVLREELPDDGILVSESTQVGYWSDRAFPVYEPRSYLTSGYQGTLGYGYATALGAQVGNPAKKVVSISGDGGFMYNVQELGTAVQQGINAVGVVFNDRAYGNVRRTQRLNFDGHIIATDLYNPDFVKLADSFGMAGFRAEGPEGLRAALKEAMALKGPALIEVPVNEMPNIRAVLQSAQARTR